MSSINIHTSEEEYKKLLEEVKNNQKSEAKVDTEGSELVNKEVASNTPPPSDFALDKVSHYYVSDPNQNLLSWVNTFKIMPLHEEDLTEGQKIIYNEIYSKFDSFVAWSKKQILK